MQPRRRRSTRLRPGVWLIGTGILTTIAVASSLERTFGLIKSPAPSFASQPLDVVAAIRPWLAAARASVPAFGGQGTRAGESAPAAVAQPVFDSPASVWLEALDGVAQPSGRIFPVRYAPALDSQDALHRPPARPEMWLTQAAPPYADSQPGRFELRLAHVTAEIEHSLFQAGQKAGLSERLILKLAEIFGWDIDFALDVQPGDRFSVIYEEKYLFGRKIGDGLILAAEFSNGGNVHRAIGFRSEDGTVGYYKPDGRNVRRPFLRTPVKFSRVSSHFSRSRYHPVLKSWRAHRGVDYAAPAGTPVRATAGGTVTFADWRGGYGKTLVIDHGASRTLYAHLSRYRKGLKAGKRVAQGSVIGYVGQSGLATGPHLHYEFQVNGKHKDPLTVEFPKGNTLAGSEREAFERAAAEWTARLDLINERQMAAR